MKIMNFLNLPVINVTMHNANNKYLHDLFITQEKVKIDWEHEYLRALRLGDNEQLRELSQNKHVNLNTYYTDYILNVFGTNYKNYDKIFDILHNDHCNFFKSCSINNNKITLNTSDGQIIAYKFSGCKDPTTSIFDNLENENLRKRQCHNLSIKLTLNANFNCKLATGYISSFSNDAKYLHSWVETTFNNKPYVIDLTRNIIIDKAYYYKIHNIQGPVYKISQKTLKKERSIFNDIAQNFKYLSKLYLINRPLAIALYKKQKSQQNKKEEYSL